MRMIFTSIAAVGLSAVLVGCDMSWKADADPDGDGYTIFQGDCDEGNPDVFPNQVETWYDGVDANCDGADDYDADGDGHQSAEHGGDDCHDDNAEAFPGSTAEEVFYDCVDQDCDGNDGDQDGDGFAAAEYSDGSGGTLFYADTCAALGRDPELVNNAPATDCWDDPDVDFLADYQGEDDLGPEDIFPTEDRVDNETFYDNIDQNCDGWSDFDADGDTYDIDDECDDEDASAYPDENVYDEPYNCVDEDCDGQDGDLDDDGFIAITWVDGDGVEHDYVAECPGWEAVNSDREEGDCWDDPNVLEQSYTSINDFTQLEAEDVHPEATERWYDGVDQDCAEDNDFDADGDFFNTSEHRDRDLQFGNDCEDADPNANPGAYESCLTNYDDDCDGYINEHGARYDTVNFYYDGDEDGFGDTQSTERQGCVDYDQYGEFSMDPQGYTSRTNDDCDDTNDITGQRTYPGAAPNDDTSACMKDVDEDEFGDLSPSRSGVTTGTDCDDSDTNINTAATEVWYNGVDNDCDDHSDYDADFDGEDNRDRIGSGTDCDDGDASINTSATEVWYDGVDQDCDDLSDFDADFDGFDSDSYGGDDCDDTTANVNPNRQEIWYDGTDRDCDGLSDYDADVDGFDSDSYGGTDCDDTNANINTSVTEVWYNGVDQDCDGASDYDADGDGFDSDSYSGTDCDDSNASINTSATEVWYNGVDQDCDGASDYDADGDNFDSDSYGGTDCDDTTANVNPSRQEIWYDGTDRNCDGLSDYDADVDGFDSDSYGGTDCDDTNASINTSATEVWYNGVDQDCDGASDYDADIDGYDSESYGGSDCDDSLSTTYPGANDTWYDGVDSNCDGASDYDADADGFDSDSYGGTDCDDGLATTYPGASDSWYDGVDSNCDGANDYDADGDGFDSISYSGDDCNDLNAAINTAATEICDNVDNDCDGATDDDDASLDSSTATLWYADTDGDGEGDEGDLGTLACDAPSGTVANNTDCDDTNGNVNTVAAEYCWDGIDNDCTGYYEDDGCYSATGFGGELLISEIFYAADVANTAWFEVSNESPGDLNLIGLTFDLDDSTAAPGDSFTVTSSLPVAAGERVVFCKNSTPSQLGFDGSTLGGGECNYVFGSASNFNLYIHSNATPARTFTLSILDFDLNVIDDVTFETERQSPNLWPDASTNPDLSIELCETSSAFTVGGNDLGTNWANVDTASGSVDLYYDPNGNGTGQARYGTPGNVNTCN
ncbi:MAG: hypothetical protein H6740_14410 [Alphaproteobacteria bacterium]|nr:hypothetical protein [Alphaproteobacteria bacterium]